MRKSDYGMILLLLILAVFIWLRDLAWMTSGDDTLPVLVALPLFVWLGTPWKFIPDGRCEFSPFELTLVVALFVLGIGINSTVLLAIGWTVLLWFWLRKRTDLGSHDSIKKLLVLPFISFPWITLDADKIGWLFRLTGAYATTALYHFFGAEVQQEGTNIIINGLPLSVEAACSGLNTLQSMLIAGTVVNYIILGDTSRYWWNLGVIITLAWIANTLRIILLSGVALIFGAEFALGGFHIWGGWAVLILMFLLCWWITSLQEAKKVV
ncbi:MAG: archaeosortase/exosortase family protein [Parachlamydiales bacterium]|jgi:exosortase